MQKYAKLLQRIHGLDKMRFEDLKVSVDPSYEPEISIEDSKQYIHGALNVLVKIIYKWLSKHIVIVG